MSLLQTLEVRSERLSAAPEAPPWLSVLAWLLALAAAAHAAYVLLAWLHAPLLDQHAFRQTQTALSAHMLLQGGPFFAYETPVVGAPWAIPFEFPLYQALAAALAAFGVQLDAAGRLVSFTFLIAAVWPLSMLWRDLALPRLGFPIACALVLASPQYAFWSRTFLVESCAWFLGLLWLALFVRFLMTDRAPLALAALATGLLATLAKATTFPAFGLLGALIALPRGLRWLRVGLPLREMLPLGLAAAALLLPFAGGLAWVAYSDAVKAANPIGALLTSQALGTWNYGTLEQRLGPALRTTITSRVLPDLFGVAGLLALVMLAGAFCRLRDAVAMLLGVLCFLVPLLVFTNLHIVHNYYQYANAAFLLAAVAIALASLATSGRAPVLAGSALVVLLGAQLAHFHWLQRAWLAHGAAPDPTYEIARAARGLLPPDGSLVVLDGLWSSVIPYYAERKAISLPSWTPPALVEAALRDPQAQLAGTRFAGVVHCPPPAPGYGPVSQPLVDAFLAGRAVLAERGNCRLLAAER